MQTDVVDRLTGQARRALLAAQRVALDHEDDHVGTEHLLSSLLADAETGAGRLLEACGVEIRVMHDRLAQLLEHGEQAIELDRLPATPAVKRVLEAAAVEADQLHHVSVGTEHLLLGLAAESAGVAGELLEQFGATLDRLREELGRMPVREDRDLGVQAVERAGAAPRRADPGVAEVRRLLDASPGPAGAVALPGEAAKPVALAGADASADSTADLAMLRAFGCLPQLAIGLLLGTLLGALWGTWTMLLCMAGGLCVGASRSGWLGMLWGAFAGYNLAQRLCPDETEALLVILVSIVAGSCIGDWPRRMLPPRRENT